MSVPVVLIQAGHEGGWRNSRSSPSGRAASNGTGGIDMPERAMTPIVADRATTVLREHGGVKVIREDAFFDQYYTGVDLFISCHFNGESRPCATGSSVGYNDPTDKPAVDLWKQIYSEYWPFKWDKDNFTRNLSGYYGYSWVSTKDSEFLIEFGEITCPEQNEWIKPRLEFLGDILAYFVSQRLNLSPGVPKPVDNTNQPDDDGWRAPGDVIITRADARAVLKFQGSLPNAHIDNMPDDRLMEMAIVMNLLMVHDIRLRNGGF